jgi:excisionase family DNA binding protein
MVVTPERNKESSRSTMLTTVDVARIFDVHPGTIRRWCQQGKVKAFRAGPRGERRFRREDVAIAYLDRDIQQYLTASQRRPIR